MAPSTPPWSTGTAGHADEVDGAHVVGGHPGATIVHAAAAIRGAAAGHRSPTLKRRFVLFGDHGTRLVCAAGGASGSSCSTRDADFLYAVVRRSQRAGSFCLAPKPHCAKSLTALVTFQANGLIALIEEMRATSASRSPTANTPPRACRLR